MKLVTIKTVFLSDGPGHASVSVTAAGASVPGHTLSSSSTGPMHLQAPPPLAVQPSTGTGPLDLSMTKPSVHMRGGFELGSSSIPPCRYFHFVCDDLHARCWSSFATVVLVHHVSCLARPFWLVLLLSGALSTSPPDVAAAVKAPTPPPALSLSSTKTAQPQALGVGSFSSLFASVVGGNKDSKDKAKDREHEREASGAAATAAATAAAAAAVQGPNTTPPAVAVDDDEVAPAPVHHPRVAREAVQRSFRTPYYVCGLAAFGPDLAILRYLDQTHARS